MRVQNVIVVLMSFFLFNNIHAASIEYPEEISRAYHHDNPWHYLPFDESMKLSQYPQAIKTTKKIVGIDGELLFTFFKDLYE